MPFEILHFRDSKLVIEEKGMAGIVKDTLEYVDTLLNESSAKGRRLRLGLEDCGWRDNGNLPIIEGRRYQYKGCLQRIAIEANFYAYEYILEGLARLQLGYDLGRIDVGLLLLTGERSAKSPFGSTKDLVAREVDSFYPTISMPVAVAIFSVAAEMSDGDPAVVEGHGRKIAGGQSEVRS
ncbi:hypothetical protein [Solidesulfovibrio sp. C21]|uniref:hypothetical protein n=1 Tax=Solidesulfovibrio sp. C21 TaxID=3398613 RepID=UPI0039FD63D7